MTTELPPAQRWRVILRDGIEHRIRVEPYEPSGVVLWAALRAVINKTVAAGHSTPDDALRYALREFDPVAVEVLAEGEPTRAELIAERDAARESLALARSHRDHLAACRDDADKHAAQLAAVLNERTAERDAWKARADEFDDSLAKETSAHIATLVSLGVAWPALESIRAAWRNERMTPLESGAAMYETAMQALVSGVALVPSDRAQQALARLAKVVAAVEVDAHDRKQLDAAVDALTRELAATEAR